MFSFRVIVRLKYMWKINMVQLVLVVVVFHYQIQILCFILGFQLKRTPAWFSQGCCASLRCHKGVRCYVYNTWRGFFISLSPSGLWTFTSLHRLLSGWPILIFDLWTDIFKISLKERKRESEPALAHLLVHSLNSYNSWARSELEPELGDENTVQISYIGHQDPTTRSSPVAFQVPH